MTYHPHARSVSNQGRLAILGISLRILGIEQRLLVLSNQYASPARAEAIADSIPARYALNRP